MGENVRDKKVKIVIKTMCIFRVNFGKKHGLYVVQGIFKIAIT